MALVFCPQCNEPIAQTIDSRGQLSAWMYAEKGYCAKHPAPPGPRELPPAGYCEWSNRVTRGHRATETWLIPRTGKRLCRRHMADFVREAIRRGSYGEKT